MDITPDVRESMESLSIVTRTLTFFLRRRTTVELLAIACDDAISLFNSSTVHI